jgi:hypothetical protein
MLDADELVTESFSREVRTAIDEAADSTHAFAICRKTMFLGKWMKRSDCFPVWIMRIVRPHVRFVDSGHGEVPIPLDANRVRKIVSPLEHYAFYKGLENWLARHNRYSSHEAKLELTQDHAIVWSGIFSFHASVRRRALRNLARNTVFRPILRFLYQYVFRLGFLEGRLGLMYCLLMANYESCILVKREELLRSEKRGVSPKDRPR